MIQEAVIEIAEELADIQRGGEILDAEGRSIAWDQEHSDEVMVNLTGPLQIPWMYSRKCNFACAHCYNSSSPTYDTTYDADPYVIADRVIEAAPYNICLCGGEPFMWKPFYEIVERLRTGGIPLVSTVTNGFLATPDAFAKAWDCGLTTLQFSIDGADAQQNEWLRPGHGIHIDAELAFDRVVAALAESLKYAWTDLSISLTPTRYNIHDCKRYIERFAAMGVTHLRFQPYMPLGRGAHHAKALQPTDEEYLRFHFELKDMQVRYPELYVDWGDPIEHLWFYALTEANCWSTGITTDGWLELSPYIPVLLGDLQKHTIGAVWAKGIKEMWHAPLVRRLAGHVHSTEALSNQEVQVYEEESLHIDVFDNEQWDALMTTDDIGVFRRFSEANLRRCRQ
jgi:MoaA/NifB/PqqE/SkfB family radical SAM enzyme